MTRRPILPDIPVGDHIPRRLHQIRLRAGADLPPPVTGAMKTLREMHPDWSYRLYDDAAAEQFIAEHYGADMLATYRLIDPAYPAAQADLLRYLICFAEGGVYLDLKSTTRRPLDEVLRPGDTFLLNQWHVLRDSPQGNHDEIREVAGGEYTNWCILSAPGHPFLRAVLEHVIDNLHRYRPLRDGVGRHGVLRTTGPIAFTRAIHPIRDDHPHRRVILDPDEGVVFSVFDDIHSHRGVSGPHYSQLVLPVVRRPWPETLVTRVAFGTVAPMVARLRARLSR